MLLALQSLHLSILLTRWLLGCSCKLLSSLCLMQKAFCCLDDISALCGNLKTPLKKPQGKGTTIMCLKHNTRQTLSRDSECGTAMLRALQSPQDLAFLPPEEVRVGSGEGPFCRI